MEEEDANPSRNFIPCVKWIRRGVAEAHPVKVELTKKELEDVIHQTRASLRMDDDDGDSGTENDDTPPDVDDEFKMDAYDEEGDGTGLNVSHVAATSAEDGYDPPEGEDAEDSEDDDDLIKPTDNLIVVGHVEDDASILEIYVYNEEEGSLYVHHDVILPSIPLALEWLNYDPDNVNYSSNMCAVGSMDPIIQVWDLDLINTIEPAYKLGRKRSRKKGIQAVGHRDAVLDLSWNTCLTHILASGSVDQTVLLWDLEIKAPNMELTRFDEKVQTLVWHPTEGQTLLTGSCDKTCKLWDCRTNDSFKSWTVGGEVERVCWNFADLNHFLASDDKGSLHFIDARTETPVWSIKAHETAVSGLSVSSVYPGLVITLSDTGLVRVWDITPETPFLTAEKILKIGQAQCLDVALESPFTIAAGGDNRSHNFIVQSIMDIESVKTRFASKTPMTPVNIEGIAVAGPSTIKPREKRQRSAERLANTKKKAKSLVKKK